MVSGFQFKTSGISQGKRKLRIVINKGENGSILRTWRPFEKCNSSGDL